jgi:murein DD-endopeptidase MepM/ murein hydrolase activator NlpD
MFAIDWVKVSDGAVFSGDGSQLPDHYAYGSEIHAATAGEVVDVRTDLPEAPVNESISGNATVKEPRDYPGNHVTVRLAPDRYAMYAHLQTGSARVKVGDQVKEGDVLGLLGSSGNASAPHLHFSIQDGPDALTSLSLPFVIDGYQLTGTANINPVSLTIDPVMSPQANTYPLTYSIIDLGA